MESGSMEKLLQLARYLSLSAILLTIFFSPNSRFVHIVIYTQVMAVDMSYRLGWIDESIVKRVNKILVRAKLPTTPPESMTVSMFKSIMAVSF